MKQGACPPPQRQPGTDVADSRQSGARIRRRFISCLPPAPPANHFLPKLQRLLPSKP